MRTVGHRPSSDPPDLVEPEPVTTAPRRRGAVMLLGLLAVVVAAVWVSKVTQGSLQKVPGTLRLTGPAKTFALDDVRTGRPVVSLQALRGRPVVLNFFASWCEPCTREMPALQAVAERYRGRVQFVGVTFNDSRDNARKALERAGVTYPAAFDAKSTLVDDYGVRGLPTTFFIGPDGNLLERKDGEFSEVQLRTVVDRLFGSEPAVASR
ncbi:MAG TPA: TlpA disulfide reductase family protein [Acidimicrobiia bacterium]|nr:TlpA disulfide reductase family protein [Acidimicrobiia bacterium]